MIGDLWLVSFDVFNAITVRTVGFVNMRSGDGDDFFSFPKFGNKKKKFK